MNLFIDTSNQYIIFALFNKDILTSSNIIETNRNQSEIFINKLSDFLLENKTSLKEIKSFYFAKGPGSFTGIRVGLSFAKALKVSGFNNIFTINSLYLLLDNYENSSAMIDARGNKVYYLEVKNGEFFNEEILEEDVVKKNNINTYDSCLENISSNVVKLVSTHKYDDDIASLYIKEAF